MGVGGVGLEPGGGSRGASLGGRGMRAMLRPFSVASHKAIRSQACPVAGDTALAPPVGVVRLHSAGVPAPAAVISVASG